MRLRSNGIAGALHHPRLCCLIFLVFLLLPAAAPRAHEAAPAPAMDNAMSSAGWLQQAFIKLESEATSDVSMLPDTPGAITREWRTFDKNGSPLGALLNIGWVALLTCVALLAERAVVVGMTRRWRRRCLQPHPDGPSVADLVRLAICDAGGLAVFIGVFVHGRHWLTSAGVPVTLIMLSTNIVIRWRIFALVFRVVLRPSDPAARLVELPDAEVRRLTRFLSAVILGVIVLIGFARYGLTDEDSGAPHVVALVASASVAALFAWIVLRARAAFESLIRGHSSGIVGALRGVLARGWATIGLVLAAGNFVFFIFGLSLGLLSYYHALLDTLGVWFLLLVLERLTELGWYNAERAAVAAGASRVDRLVAQGLRRILLSAVLLIATVAIGWIWSDALELDPGLRARAVRATIAAAATLFIGYLLWELIRVTIDRHLLGVAAGPKLPGDEDEESGPGSRLQTVLPMLRIMIGALIAVVATLVVLSRLGIDTAPLIAGAGVFGLAISFGSQSLVRDVISGLFYMWDDAFRIGEYIDTGRLKGTVEALGIRSVKVRHHNGPLHTIPYGQLGSVTNTSRDFATIKFNLRLEPGTDIELVRRTAKKIGIAMQEEPEIASEVMLPLKMQGIADVADTAVIVRFKFTARPIKPGWIQREYLKRMYRVFAEQGIHFASGTLTLQTSGSTPSGSVAPAPSPTADITPLALAEAAAVRVA